MLASLLPHLAAPLLLLAATPPAPADAERATFTRCTSAPRVTCVVDGDTLWLRGTKVRLADIDTPEITRPGCAAERALGERATLRLLALVNAGPFTLTPAGRDEDRYGRKLRVIERGGQSLGAVLVAEGLARPWSGRREGWCAAG